MSSVTYHVLTSSGWIAPALNHKGFTPGTVFASLKTRYTKDVVDAEIMTRLGAFRLAALHPGQAFSYNSQTRILRRVLNP